MSSEICWRRGLLSDMAAPFGSAGILSELQGQWLGCSLLFLEIVRRQGREPTVVNRAAHREVVEALPLA